jgi:flagellar secretion chaperone FliS
MWNNGHETYLESRVLGADPLELVSLLYQGCRQAVRDAREHLAGGRIAERSRAISKACEILTELAGSLDHTQASEISQRLALLYDYMQRRLLDANMHQADQPLAEVLGLLTTLGEAWESVNRSTSKAAPQAESPWSQPAAMEPAHAGAPHAWSF